MDQASSLRELMGKMNGKDKKEKERKATSVAFLSTDQVEHMSDFLKKLSYRIHQSHGKSVALLGIEQEDGYQMEDYVYRKCERQELKKTIMRSVDVLPGSLQFIETIRTSPSSFTRFIQLVEKTEQESDLILYDAGSQLSAVNVNLSMATNQIVLVTKPTASSLQDAISYLKILFKMNVPATIGLVVDTSDGTIARKHCKKLQEIALSEFNYHIEMVGCFDFKYIPLFTDAEIFETFHSEFFMQTENQRIFSESLSSMMH